MMKNRILAGVFLVLFSIGIAGCKDPYGTCIKADSDIAQGVSSAFATIQQLQSQGLISAAEAVNVAGYFEFANQADEAFGVCVQAAYVAGSTAGAYTACASTFNTALDSPAELALIHVSNPTTQAKINTMVTGISTGVSLVITALGGK